MVDRRRIKEHAIRRAVPVAVYAVVVAVLVAFWASQLDDLGPWWVLAVVLAVGIVLLSGAALLAAILTRRRLVGDKIELALRAPGGRWRHGRAELREHTMTFLPSFWQVRILTGGREDITVLSIDARFDRRPRIRELWALDFHMRIVAVETTAGTLEMAASPSDIDRVARELAAPRD